MITAAPFFLRFQPATAAAVVGVHLIRHPYFCEITPRTETVRSANPRIRSQSDASTALHAFRRRRSAAHPPATRRLRMSGPARTIAEKRADFRALHAAGCFVLPNPWDVGSARYLQGLGFKALATTSSGFAWSRGHADNTLPREAILAHLREIVEATDLPVNADFENGFGADPAGVGESVGLCVDTGVAGLSIEDSTPDPAIPLYD